MSRLSQEDTKDAEKSPDIREQVLVGMRKGCRRCLGEVVRTSSIQLSPPLHPPAVSFTLHAAW